MFFLKPCFQSTRFRQLIVVLVASFCASTLSAHQNGQVGSSQYGCGGFGCHGGQSGATSVSLSGPLSVTAGSLNNYTFTVAHPSHTYSGFNVSIVGQGGGAAGNLAGAGGNVQAIGGELTHTAPTEDGAGGGADFAFTWTAPNEPGTYTFYGAGNAVNHNGQPDAADVYNMTGAITITVKGVNITAPNGGSYCRSSALTINWTQSGYTNFKIELSSNGFTNSEVITNSVAATANTYSWTIPASQEVSNNYQIRIVNTADGQEIKRSNSFAIKGGPNITTQPQGQTVCEGRLLQLFVASDNGTATYQWKKDGNVIPGASGAAYQVAVAKVSDAGTYEAVVFGCNGSTTSNPAVVVIGLKPKITLQPIGKTVCENDSVSLTADGEGEGAVFQWYKNGAALPGKTSKTLKIAHALLTDEGAYALHVSSSCLPDAVTTEATINVTERPAITVQPTDKNLKAGDTLTLNVDGFGEGITFQWKKNGVVIPGATQKVYKKTSIVRADSGLYEAEIKNECGAVTSRKALVRVIPSDGPGLPELASASLELGAMPLCARIDTTLSGLLRNAGATPLNVTSISVDPPTLLMAQGFTTPQSIAVGAAVDLHLVVTPTALGTISGTVKFFTANGTATFQVNGSAESGLVVDADTLRFLEGETNFNRCVGVSIDARCSSATITQAKLEGVGAGSYRVVPTFPIEITAGNKVDLCIETTAGTGGDATVVIETSAGPQTVNLRRAVFSSVDDYTTLNVLIQPNPTSADVTIKGLPQGATVRIMSLQGSEVVNLTVQGDNASTLVWDGRDTSGASVPSGSYIVLISANNRVTAHTVIMAR